MTAPIAAYIGPTVEPWITDAVAAGGAVATSDPAAADVVLWRGSDHERLAEVLAEGPGIRWVQLGAAGTDAWAPTGMFADGRLWTSAKGAYSDAVAEHAVALTLSMLRDIPRFARAHSWSAAGGRNLYGARVLVLGASGGIGQEIIQLLAPFRTRILAAGRQGVTDEESGDRLDLLDALALADVVIAATPLTPDTRGMLSRPQFAAMRPTAIVVNIARGAVIDTDALVEALTDGQIAGAALDVTDPEPLPDGHPLWSLENCLITPHSANTVDMLIPQLAQRITENLLRFADGRPLAGTIDAAKGY